MGIIEEPSFSERIDELSRIYPRMAEVKAAIDWAVSHDPEWGTPLQSNQNYRIMKLPCAPGMPDMRVLYRYGLRERAEQMAYLLYLDPIEPSEAEF